VNSLKATMQAGNNIVSTGWRGGVLIQTQKSAAHKLSRVDECAVYWHTYMHVNKAQGSISGLLRDHYALSFKRDDTPQNHYQTLLLTSFSRSGTLQIMLSLKHYVTNIRRIILQIRMILAVV
jgi:hypothetical protein